MKITKATAKSRAKRILRHVRGRKKIHGTAERPRLSIFRGGNSIYAQLINDDAQKSIFGIATNTKKAEIKGKNKEAAITLGKAVAEQCKANKIETVVFDKGGYVFHGVIKAFADSVREGGVKF
jgi:large subunit ribosomal protein L18